MRTCFQKKICPECGREISVLNYNRHLNTHKNGTFQKYQTMNHLQHDGLTCQFCGKVCKSRKSLAQHEIRCTFNNNRIDTTLSGVIAMNKKQPWNKGLTKETDERVMKGVLTFQKNYQDGKFVSHQKGVKRTQEERQKIRDGIHLDTLIRHNRSHWGTYRGIHCDSSWELAFLVYNLENGIDIKRNTKPFLYKYDGFEHHYYPDFVIGNTFYEIKGYMTEQAMFKIEQARNVSDIVLIQKDEIQPYLKYVIDKYGEDFCSVLYDSDKPMQV